MVNARDVDSATLRKLAVLADADPRSVAKVLGGRPVRGAVLYRIEAVLTAAGLTPTQATPATGRSPETPDTGGSRIRGGNAQ